MTRHIKVERLVKMYESNRMAPVFGGLSRMFHPSLDVSTISRGKIALQDVSFAIEQGERVGIIGANGAGKSTLLQILAGVAHPTSGSVSIEGRVHAVLTLGMGLREDMTGRENLYLEGEIQGKTRAQLESIVRDMIAFTELDDFIDQPVRTYSTGMKARLSFASLVFVEPDILLLDEALAVGDHHFSMKSSHAIKTLCDKGNIVVVISHNREALNDLCTRCLWLDAGRLVADGDPRTVTQAYAEHVRQQDEEQIAEQCRNQVQGFSVDGLTSITEVAFQQNQEGVTRNVVVLGNPLKIRVGFLQERAYQTLDMRLRVERWDGLLLSENVLSESGLCLHSKVGQREVELTLPELNLRPSLYRIRFELFGDGSLVAFFGTWFKSITDKASFGGEPALRGAVHMRAQRLA